MDTREREATREAFARLMQAPVRERTDQERDRKQSLNRLRIARGAAVVGRFLVFRLPIMLFLAPVLLGAAALVAAMIVFAVLPVVGPLAYMYGLYRLGAWLWRRGGGNKNSTRKKGAR